MHLCEDCWLLFHLFTFAALPALLNTGRCPATRCWQARAGEGRGAGRAAPSSTWQCQHACGCTTSQALCMDQHSMQCKRGSRSPPLDDHCTRNLTLTRTNTASPPPQRAVVSGAGGGGDARHAGHHCPALHRLLLPPGVHPHFYRVQLCFCKSRLRAPVHSGCLLAPPPERMDPSAAHHLPNPPVHKNPVPSTHAELHLQLQLQLLL